MTLWVGYRQEEDDRCGLGHRVRCAAQTGMKLMWAPPAAPALNPPERIFEKQAAVERELTILAADLNRVH